MIGAIKSLDLLRKDRGSIAAELEETGIPSWRIRHVRRMGRIVRPGAEGRCTAESSFLCLNWMGLESGAMQDPWNVKI
jgi:hypothetical protein